MIWQITDKRVGALLSPFIVIGLVVLVTICKFLIGVLWVSAVVAKPSPVMLAKDIAISDTPNDVYSPYLRYVQRVLNFRQLDRNFILSRPQDVPPFSCGVMVIHPGITLSILSADNAASIIREDFGRPHCSERGRLAKVLYHHGVLPLTLGKVQPPNAFSDWPNPSPLVQSGRPLHLSQLVAQYKPLPYSNEGEADSESGDHDVSSFQPPSKGIISPPHPLFKWVFLVVGIPLGMLGGLGFLGFLCLAEDTKLMLTGMGMGAVLWIIGAVLFWHGLELIYSSDAVPVAHYSASGLPTSYTPSNKNIK